MILKLYALVMPSILIFGSWFGYEQTHDFVFIKIATVGVYAYLILGAIAFFAGSIKFINRD